MSTEAPRRSISEAGAWWEAHAGRPGLGARVQAQVDRLLAAGVGEDRVRDLVRDAANESCSVLGPAAALPVPARGATPAPAGSVAVRVLAAQAPLVARVQAATGWTRERAVREVAAELVLQPGGVAAPVDRTLADLLVTAYRALAIDEGAAVPGARRPSHGVPAGSQPARPAA